MNLLRNIAVATALSLTNVAANAALKPLPEKYQFDQLPEVERFNRWSIDDYTMVDRQSLIVRTSPSKSYLLILQRKLPGIGFNDAIAVTSTGSQIHARFDTVQIIDRHFSGIPVPIAKIYKLDGREQRKQIKSKIRES
ncbi:MAG: DUF6491 family protein [Pseudomonadales bacterium]